MWNHDASSNLIILEFCLHTYLFLAKSIGGTNSLNNRSIPITSLTSLLLVNFVTARDVYNKHQSLIGCMSFLSYIHATNERFIE